MFLPVRIGAFIGKGGVPCPGCGNPPGPHLIPNNRVTVLVYMPCAMQAGPSIPTPLLGGPTDPPAEVGVVESSPWADQAGMTRRVYWN